ncbi:hypothetical protein ACFC06_26715 [Nocardia sp. NPDC056064]|uniref:hypothetical protein n=1 Tax=Nocardia sp. NPDC056064 TaxID=3345701 RepID=UPI0035E3990A
MRSSATGGMLIGGHALDTSSSTVNPVPELLDLSAGSADVLDAPTDVRAELARLRHGDPALGHFEQNSYGRFTVTGFAVEAPVGQMFLLGGLILVQTGSQTPGACLTGLRRLDDTDAGPGPARIDHWPDPETD